MDFKEETYMFNENSLQRATTLIESNRQSPLRLNELTTNSSD